MSALAILERENVRRELVALFAARLPPLADFNGRPRPEILAVLGRLEAPGLYVSGQTDSVVLVLPKLASAGVVGTALGALVAAGAFAAFLSTSSGLFISMAGALSHDIMDRGVRTFRVAAVVIGVVMTTLGVFVAGISINVLVGWAFAIAASTFCPLLLLGIWWRRLTWVGALGGLALGGGADDGLHHLRPVVVKFLGADRRHHQTRRNGCHAGPCAAIGASE